MPAFDVVRAGAATLVFLFHYAGLAGPRSSGMSSVDSLEWVAARLGSIGTNLLLLLSGFLIAQSVASGRFTYFQFVSLRLIRIYVPYLVVVAMAVGFGQAFPQYSRADVSGLSLGTLLEQLLLFPGLFPDRPVLTVTWTLSYVVAGYLLFPVIGFALRNGKVERRGRLAVWGAVTALFFASALYTGVPSIRFCYVPAGCLLFKTQAEMTWEKTRPGFLRTLLAVAGLSLVLRVCLDGKLFGGAWPDLLFRALYTGSGLIFVSSMIGVALVTQHRYGLSEGVPFLKYLAGYGRTGYSFYLVHGPVVKLFALIAFPMLAAMQAPASAYWLLMPICWGVAAASALVLYRFVERPTRRLLVQKVSRIPGGR